MTKPVLLLLAAWSTALLPLSAQDATPVWPPVTETQKPWAFWWWMGSAVDKENLTRELTRYRDAGMGGVQIIPIYGAKGSEGSYIPFLSPQWIGMLQYTVAEGKRLGLGIDMTLGSGWCFGGPGVTKEEASAKIDFKQLLAANGDSSAVRTQPSDKVKRAGPGGEGWMINPFYGKAMDDYLKTFDGPLGSLGDLKPRAVHQDSYEYFGANWSPDFPEAFEKRRGYRFQDELPALLTTPSDDHASRVRSDYRETLSDLMCEVTMPKWVSWSHDHGFLARYQAHGAPANLLDLYALADIPETEMFNKARNRLFSKFASSAAHVGGHPLCSGETGTWLAEHFTETLADMKNLVDDMFLSGINHIVYHGVCYSPDEVAWPGWVFYASTEMNPRNSIWHDVGTLNAYITRCQSVLQAGQPDGDLLLYWPVYDAWSEAGKSLVHPFAVDDKTIFEGQSFGRAAAKLYERGYQFDYVSDRQIARLQTEKGRIAIGDVRYRALVVPKCKLMPEGTLETLLDLARKGATVIFEEQLPEDVPGWTRLDERREKLRTLTAAARGLSGKVVVGPLLASLEGAGVPREFLCDQPGLQYVRRALPDGVFYFISNKGNQAVDGWISLAKHAEVAYRFDPMSGAIGSIPIRARETDLSEVYLQLAPGESTLVRLFSERRPDGPSAALWRSTATPVPLTGTWHVRFLTGGPELPPPFDMDTLASWTQNGGDTARAFDGTALYTLTWDAPTGMGTTARLDLGKVCQSARVRLNGQEMGTLIAPPFQIVIGPLLPKGNVLEIEVTNTSANRISDLDRRGVAWHEFNDIGVVGTNYKPFNASKWPLADSGLLGPVTLTPVAPLLPASTPSAP
ncbi:alpha-L-rhamnosidase [Verrucomicrobium sp. GAS474]|uniref:glycosyl hydrolase n=1 Tax=Verrucomicrobium sp. GAS474 TaxID=1882831 RepID=UPI00087A24E9|nr:glycosyl hydrolase [Verrucomicrobium sp. GAS474]SDU27519.1 alpha-L-rhamnosidase [Verrucomicrobium sp. GAS474]